MAHRREKVSALSRVVGHLRTFWLSENVLCPFGLRKLRSSPAPFSLGRPVPGGLGFPLAPRPSQIWKNTFWKFLCSTSRPSRPGVQTGLGLLCLWLNCVLAPLASARHEAESAGELRHNSTTCRSKWRRGPRAVRGGGSWKGSLIQCGGGALGRSPPSPPPTLVGVGRAAQLGGVSGACL